MICYHKIYNYTIYIFKTVDIFHESKIKNIICFVSEKIKSYQQLLLPIFSLFWITYWSEIVLILFQQIKLH